MPESTGTHKRRPHYSGNYPRSYAEKYKELQPEKYAGMASHVAAKGRTPAGMHIPICVTEIMDFLDIRPGETGLDATLGYGGHTRAILGALCGKGILYALDVDPVESAKTVERLRGEGFGEDVFRFRLTNFSNIDTVAAEAGGFDFIMADLGVSSMQIDNPERGFSIKADGPLDLRLDPTSGAPASERLMRMSAGEIEGMLEENADEPDAALIARAIVRQEKRHPILTTSELRNCIEGALGHISGPDRQKEIKKACQRCFQALRIDVNNEFEALDGLLSKLPYALRPGGRLAILSFHSGEDRMVKQSFRNNFRDGVYSFISPDITRPSAEEIYNNPRAASAKLRFAIRRGGTDE